MKELKDLTELELKAAVYDRISVVERCKIEIEQINLEISKRKDLKDEHNKSN